MRINHATIDHVFLAPDKIKIPERYVPEAVSNVYTISPKGYLHTLYSRH